MKEKKPKKKPKKKPRRVVLGVGHPWFSGNAITMYEVAGQWLPHAPLNYGDLGNWNKIRLVAEVLK